MAAYIVLLAFILGVYALSAKIIARQRRAVFIVVSYFAILIFIILQQRIGPDYENYIRIFNTIKDTPWSEVTNVNLSVEIGYVFINKIFSVFIDNGAVFFRVFISFTIIFMGIACYKHSINPLIYTLGVLALLFGWLPILRQAMATAILAMGYGYVKRKQIWQYIILVVLAMTLHVTAIIAIFIYPLYHITRGDNVWRMLMAFALVIILVAREQLVVIIQQVVSAVFNPRYAKYFSSEDFGYNSVIIFSGLTLMLALFLDLRVRENNRVLNIMLFITLLQCSSALTPMAGRVMMYYLPLVPLCMERLLPGVSGQVETRDKKSKKILLQTTTMSVKSKAIITTTDGNKIFILICLFAFTVFYWWYTYIRVNPYVIFSL